MKGILLFIFLLPFIAINAQRTIDVTSGDVTPSNFFLAANGTPAMNTKFTKVVEGTPYFTDEWLSSTIVLDNGREYKNIKTKVDLFDHELRYLDDKGKELIASKNIREVVLFDSVRNMNFRFFHSSSLPVVTGLNEGWYQWLHSGNATLYKYFKKSISENKPYGSATTEQSISTAEQYLVLYNNVLLEIKRIKDAPSVLSNKKAELEAYLKTKDNKALSMDDRMTALIAYYNSLFK
jgi:hypothetical protein